MDKYELNNMYFQWMCRLVRSRRRSDLSYRKLLRHLHSRDFTYLLPMDGNRAEDGTDLRYRFGDENGIDERVIASCLDIQPCSVLEMMTALALRCEEHIMGDPDAGDRTGEWFWGMISSLGLKGMTDSRYDRNRTDDILDRFLAREYEPNGKGGLFQIPHCGADLRSVEIWYQMCWYLDTILQV